MIVDILLVLKEASQWALRYICRSAGKHSETLGCTTQVAECFLYSKNVSKPPIEETENLGTRKMF